MNWSAAAFALVSVLVLAGLFVGYLKLGDWIQERFGYNWAVYYGSVIPLALIFALLIGVVA